MNVIIFKQTDGNIFFSYLTRITHLLFDVSSKNAITGYFRISPRLLKVTRNRKRTNVHIY